jgi:hypothetical protein
MTFRIPTLTSADDVAVWLSGAKQQLDDYFVQLPASHYDEFFSHLPAAEQLVEAQAMRNAEQKNYLLEIERQAKRFGYKPERRRVEEAVSGGDIDTEFVPENAPVNSQARSAKAPQGAIRIEGDIFMPLEEEQAMREQFRGKGNAFFDELKKRGLIQVLTPEGNRVVPKKYAIFDETLGERGRYTLKPEVQSYLESRKVNTPQGVVSQPIAETPLVQSSPLPNNAESEATLNDLDNLFLNSQTQPTPQEVPGTVTTISTDNGAIAPDVVSVLSTQPGFSVVPEPVSYSPLPIPEGTPESGINRSVYPGSKAVSTSSGIPMSGGGGSIPPKPPTGGGNYDFDGEEFNRQNNYTPYGGTPNHPEIPGLNDPVDADANLKWLWERNQRETQARQQYLNDKARQVADTGSWWGNVWDGVGRGFNYSVEAGRMPGRTASVIWNRAPKKEYEHLTPEGKAAFFGGRVAGEIGNGTKQVLWELHPDDFTATHSVRAVRESGGNRIAQVLIPYMTTTALQLGSQTYNPFNLGEGGRVAGYQAINPDEDDPRISTSPVSELLIDRGLLGRRGKLLPWEQFRQERTDIPYEQYQKYQDYLRNKDDNFLRDATGGLIKGTMDGINGPELSVMGYSVTPTGALAAGAALLAGRELVRTGRIAGLRK